MGIRRGVAVLLAGLLLGSCAGAPSATMPPPATTVILAASPSPSGESPGTSALARLADPKAELRATITGTIAVSQTATQKGTYKQVGRDFHVTFESTLGSATFTTEQKVIAEQSYLLVPGRPWRHDPVASGANRAPTLAEALSSVEIAGPGGSTTIAGATVDQYDLGGLLIGDLTAALGLSDPGAKPTAASSAFFASADGTPVALDLRFTVPTTAGTPASFDLRLTFESGGDPVSVTAPVNPWLAKADGHGYRLWHPERWRPNLDPSAGPFTDEFIGPDSWVIVYCIPDNKDNLKAWAADGLEFYTKRFGGKPDSTSSESLGDIPVRISTWNDGTVDGDKRGIVNLALVKGPVACDIQWFHAPGSPAAEEATFQTLLTTFSLE